MSKSSGTQIFKVKFIKPQELTPQNHNIKNIRKIHLDLQKSTVKTVQQESNLRNPDSNVNKVSVAEVTRTSQRIAKKKSSVNHSKKIQSKEKGKPPEISVINLKRGKKLESDSEQYSVAGYEVRSEQLGNPVCKIENVDIGESIEEVITDLSAIEEVVISSINESENDKFSVENGMVSSDEGSAINQVDNEYGFSLNGSTGGKQKVIKCKFCSYVTDKAWDMRKHREIHVGRKTLSCPFCSYISPSKPRLLSHIRVHTGERPYVCEYCTFSTKQRYDLTRHKRIHTGEKPYKCNKCSFSASDKRALIVHQRSHTGEQPFRCEICSLCVTQRQQLERHLRTHTGEKPFKCELCLYRASRKHHLVSHMRTHTGEKPYKCNLCSYSCIQKFSLELHLKNHSEGKRFKCDFCSYSSNRKKVVLNHQEIHLIKIKKES